MMGCDIHAHAEIKRHDRWLHWDKLDINRCHELFEKMAGVRGDISKAIAPPRGMPDDASETTQLHCALWGTDGHSHSWLSLSEMAELEYWIWEHDRVYRFMSVGYLLGNGWKAFLRDPPEQNTTEEEAKSMGVTDARLVFWFDN